MAINNFKNSSSNSWHDSDANLWKTTSRIYYVRNSIEETWVLELEPMLSVIEEPFFMATVVPTGLWELIYSNQMGVTFVQPYGDVDNIVTPIFEYYGDCAIPLQRYVLLYDDSDTASANYDLKWDIYASTSATFTESYAITEFGLVNTIEETYQLRVLDTVLSTKELPYHMLSGASSTETPTTTIVVDVGNTGNLQEIEFISINITAGIEQYSIICDLVISSEVYYLCSYLDNITVMWESTTFEFFIENKSRSITNSSVSYKMRILSPTVKLDAPYSKTLVDNLDNGTMAQALVVSMAALQNVTVDYQIIDWFIPGYAISVNDETPLTVIKKVVNAVGGIVQTKPNGDMLIISRYPNPIPVWDGIASIATFSTSDAIIALTDTLSIRDGFNAFMITDQGSSSESITLEVVDIDGLTKTVKGYRVPFEDGAFPLETSGEPDISIDRYIYPREPITPIQSDDPDWDSETMEIGEDDWEVVEFIEHVGTTSKPIYSVVESDWIEDDLGAFQISEDGTLSIINTTSVPGESLLRIKYRTKYWEWTVSGPTDRPVQFYVPEIEEE